MEVVKVDLIDSIPEAEQNVETFLKTLAMVILVLCQEKVQIKCNQFSLF